MKLGKYQEISTKMLKETRLKHRRSPRHLTKPMWRFQLTMQCLEHLGCLLECRHVVIMGFSQFWTGSKGFFGWKTNIVDLRDRETKDG